MKRNAKVTCAIVWMCSMALFLSTGMVQAQTTVMSETWDNVTEAILPNTYAGLATGTVAGSDDTWEYKVAHSTGENCGFATMGSTLAASRDINDTASGTNSGNYMLTYTIDPAIDITAVDGIRLKFRTSILKVHNAGASATFEYTTGIQLMGSGGGANRYQLKLDQNLDINEALAMRVRESTAWSLYENFTGDGLDGLDADGVAVYEITVDISASGDDSVVDYFILNEDTSAEVTGTATLTGFIPADTLGSLQVYMSQDANIMIDDMLLQTLGSTGVDDWYLY